MPLDIIRILQIGDVHYPDGKSSASNIDIKDDGVLDEFSQSISSNAFQSVARKIISVIEDDCVDHVAFMGDLTSRGCLDGYEECAQYLSRGFRLSSSPLISPAKIQIVAGNHDVCRQTAAEEPEKKFDVLTERLEANGFSGLSVTTVDQREVRSGEIAVQMLGINSCIGCGEKRFLPRRVRDVIANKIEADFEDSEIDDAEVLDDVFEQLDAPAIHADTITELVERIEAMSDNELGIIVAHHNLLPQSTPRIDPYTELLNSGSLRSTISELGKPILFLHGHIHTDPIEIIQNPVRGKRPLVCISAPAFDHGFNILEIGFDEENTPIGCRVLPYRVNSSGFVRKSDEQMIPLGGIPTRILDETSSRGAAIIISRGVLTGIDFLQEANAAGVTSNEEESQNLLLQLYWHGMVNIENRSKSLKHWRVRSLMG